MKTIRCARSDCYVIGKYKTSGEVVNASLISGLNLPTKVICDGRGNLFVSTVGNGTVGKYTTSGQVVNASLISGPELPAAIGINLDDLCLFWR